MVIRVNQLGVHVTINKQVNIKQNKVMKKHKKYCRYCGEPFYSKRIDAQYCSHSCRGMGNRSKINSDLYEGTMLVQFKLEPEVFHALAFEGFKEGLTAEQYAKHLCIEIYNQKTKDYE